MIPGLDYYRPSGQPGYITAQFLSASVGSPAQSIMISDSLGNNDVYTYGVNFSGRDVFEAAASLCAAVNADKSLRADIPVSILPIRRYFAIPYGSYVCVISTTPGGDDVVLTTSDPAWFQINGVGSTSVSLQNGIGGDIEIFSGDSPATGTNWTQLTVAPQRLVTVSNGTPAALNVGTGSSNPPSTWFNLPVSTTLTFPFSGATSLFFQRTDHSNTTVTLRGYSS